MSLVVVAVAVATTTDDGAAHITVVPTADGAAVTVSPPAIGAAAAHPAEARGPATSLAAAANGDRMDAWLLARQSARRDRAARLASARLDARNLTDNLTAYHLSSSYRSWREARDLQRQRWSDDGTSRPAFNLTAYRLSPEYIAWKSRRDAAVREWEANGRPAVPGPGTDLRAYFQRSWNTATAEGYDCTRPRRFGPSGDGGKVVCLDAMPPAAEPCFMLSIGYGSDAGFEHALHAAHPRCTVELWDGTVAPREQLPGWLTFHGRNFEKGSWRRYRGRRVDILKIDCEGCEYSVLEPLVHQLRPEQEPRLQVLSAHKIFSAAHLPLSG